MRRSKRGSLFPLIALCATVFVFGLVCLCQLAIHWLSFQRAQAASEAAALAAANELTNVVINDPHFGFVSLSNDAAGTNTLTEAGEPIPVVGINTIIATCRTNLLIAEQIGNPKMKALALSDLEFAKSAALTLQSACVDALKQRSSSRPCDRDGKQIDAYHAAEQTYKGSMGWLSTKFALQDMKIQVGWVDADSSSMTQIPQPLDLSQVQGKLNSNGEYSAFVNVPVSETAFYFAGLAQNSSLASTARFQAPDGKRICSAIKVSAIVVPLDASSLTQSLLSTEGISTSACAIPFARLDIAPPAVMALSFPHGRVNQMRSFADMLASPELSRASISIKQSSGGDFPDDPGAQLVSTSQGSSDVIACSPSELVAKGMYDWLRSCHGKVRLDSVSEMLDSPFSWDPSAPQTVLYGLEADGRIKRIQSKVFNCQTIHDKQEYAASDEVRAWGKTWTFTWRDEVSKLGYESGKHGGLPLFDRKLNATAAHTYQKNGLAVAMEFSSPL